jgi:putative transposase
LFFNRENVFVINITKRYRILDSVPEIEWASASLKARVLAPLAQLEDCTIEDMDEAAALLKVSRATAYRLLARYKQSLETTSLLPETPGRKPGTSKLNHIQETIIQEAIHGFFLSRQRPSVAALHRSIGLDCFQAKVPKPAYKTVRARVRAVKPQDFLRSRYGSKAAADKFNPIL